MIAGAAPRVLLIAQWPTIRNAEYELIERVRRTECKITVVDFLGFDVATGRCLNGPKLCDEYDFAISLHYETPKFLNIATFLWVANPLEFIHAQGNYRTHLIHHLRSYDDYLYNGSDCLRQHIKTIIGADWKDSGLGFFQACSRKALLAPRLPGEVGPKTDRLFYCGVNWEAVSDKSGRAQGLLETLEQRHIADFYGPRCFLDVNVWGGFPSYQGEIPFDGVSMFPAMHGYGAVLALSSPAHIKSKTSSGRAMEGFAAGVPVLSDDNHHVRSQFGDLVLYIGGSDEQERADSIQEAMHEVRSRPDDAIERVRAAQDLISREYCFEACFDRINEAVQRTKAHRPVPVPTSSSTGRQDPVVDVILFFHDPYAPDKTLRPEFANIPHIMRAMSSVANRGGVRFRLLHFHALGHSDPDRHIDHSGIEWVEVHDDCILDGGWPDLRLGEKLSRLARLSSGEFAVFFTQSDFPQYDYFEKALEWFSVNVHDNRPALHVGGFYVNDFSSTAPTSANGILRNSASTGLYRWTQNSIAEHQLGQLCFNRGALATIDRDRLQRFDVLLPLAVVLECMSNAMTIHRSRHLLMRAVHGYYHRYHNAFSLVAGKGLWAQHYELLSNATHEINGLYDAFHESPDAIAIADRIYGTDIPTLPPVDPAVRQVNDFINRMRPYARIGKRIARFFRIGT
jgi:hypothetical protein